MIKTDAQLKSNDCGISAVKTIFNIFQKDVSRKHIENSIPTKQEGSRLSDIQDFFNNSGYKAEFKILDINYIQGNVAELEDYFPFILPIEHDSGLHFVVVNELKGKKLKVFDPSKGRQYYMSLQELKRISHYSKSTWTLAESEDKIKALCTEDLAEYNIDAYEILQHTDFDTLFNKLTYFSYLKENFGFADGYAEKEFLVDLIKNQDISVIPKHFKTLKYKSDKVRVKAPIILSVKQLKERSTVELPKTEKESLYWKLFQQLGQFKRLWYIYIFAALFSGTTAQFSVFINQLLIDEVLPSFNLGTLLLFAIGLGVYKLFDLGTSVYKSIVAIHLRNVLDRYFLQNFDEKINSFSLPYIQSYKKGDLIERISDSLKLKTFFLSFFTRVLVDVFVAVYSLGILFYLSWKLTFIVVIVMVLFFAWFKIITPYLKQNERIRYIRKADFISKMVEKIEGIQVVKSFQTERHHSNKIFNSINEYLKIQMKTGYINLINNVVVAIIIIISSILILTFLSKTAILDQTITLGQIITFIALSGKIISSLRSILDENITLQENEVILRRFMDFDEQAPEQQDDSAIRDFSIDKLEISRLSFGYLPNDDVLKGVSMLVEKGDKIKIEGQNGSGKSTLGKILTALYKPHAGSIKINDTESIFYHNESLKSKILLVTNEDILFNDTIKGNICMGKDVSIPQILSLAKKVGFYEFLSSKDEGLDFMINENAKNLSTGQRKKILILRALVSSAEIVIVDEVLSGMDMESREQVENLINDDKGRTYILISHEPIKSIEFSKNYKITNGELVHI